MSENTLATVNETQLAVCRENFKIAMADASSIDIISNAAAAFDAAIVVSHLRSILTDDVMNQVFMPLMNTKIGFRTDRDPNRPSKTGPAPTPYSINVVRDCIIDAAAHGLYPTGNQFNIISGTMYPTKEGYTALLQKLKKDMDLIYTFEFDAETIAKSSDKDYVAIPCKIAYKTNREDLSGYFKYTAMVKSNGSTSTTDQLRGKAERKCKKAFFEFLTGLDLGDADASETVDVPHEDLTESQKAMQKAREIAMRNQAAADNSGLSDEEKAAIEQQEIMDFNNQ